MAAPISSAEAGHEDQGLDVAVPDAACVGAQDAAEECAVLDLPPRTFRCQPGLDSVRPGGVGRR
jgi:hypothetical protein